MSDSLDAAFFAPFFAPFSARPRALAVRTPEGELTWAELDARARAWADQLSAHGVAPGDRLAVSGPAGLSLLALVVANLRLGVVHVPINGRYRDAEIRHILADSGARLLVAPPDSDAAATARALSLPLLPLEPSPPAAAAPPHWPAPPPPSAVALLIYTSGTTGRAKGVALSHGALAANVGATTALWRFSPDDLLVLALPLFHVHGLGLGVLGALRTGLALDLHPRFDPAAVVEAFAARGATVFMGVPTMYAHLLDHLDAHPDAAAALARARLFTAGSAALPPAVLDAFAARTGHRILERYGMTETGFVLSNPYDGERRAGTVGLPVPGWEVRVVDDEGAPCPAGVAGELQVRGDGLMSGYWGDPAATAAAFAPGGWLRTGDVVRVDPDGYHRVVGRASVDILKCGGFKIAAREIEEALLTDPRLAEVAVVGLPDPVWGERIAAAVVLDPGVEAPAPDALLAELQARVSALLADYKKPRELRLLEALPRNALGKVQKHLLKG